MEITVGQEKVSVTIVRKTDGDLIVSQHSSERWFDNAEDADRALGAVMAIFSQGPPQRNGNGSLSAG